MDGGATRRSVRRSGEGKLDGKGMRRHTLRREGGELPYKTGEPTILWESNSPLFKRPVRTRSEGIRNAPICRTGGGLEGEKKDRVQYALADLHFATEVSSLKTLLWTDDPIHGVGG